MSAPQFQLIRVDQHDGVPVIYVQTSELRADKVIARLEQELDECLKASGASKVVLDLTAVHFMASSGLRVLIVLRKRLKEAGGRFTMCGVHPYVADVFRTTRLFSESFDFLPDLTSAVAALKTDPPKPTSSK